MDAEVVRADDESVEKARKALRIMRGIGRGIGENGPDPEEGRREHAVLESQMEQVLLMHHARDGTVLLTPRNEPAGTKVWVRLLMPILTVLDHGLVMLIDELDSSLHPLLVETDRGDVPEPQDESALCELIFNAHDVNLLGLSDRIELGRDQIWLTEKAGDGNTQIRSLAEYKGRRDESVPRRYLRGRYGGVPTLDHAAFDDALRNEQGQA